MNVVDELVKKLVDEGLLIEGGWQSYRMTVLPPNAPKVQIEECRRAFFCGAQHLFASIIGAMDANSEPTENDLRRVSNISEELHGFVEEMKRETREKP